MPADKCRRNDTIRKSPFDTPNVTTNSSKKHRSMPGRLGKRGWETRYSHCLGYASMGYLLITKEKWVFTAEIWRSLP